MKKNSLHTQTEWLEFQKIIEWFPQAKIKADYNREILDIGAELPIGSQVFILLKGAQTNDYYEIITPECECIEGLTSMAEVASAISALN